MLAASRPEMHDGAMPSLPSESAQTESPPWQRSLPHPPTPLIGRETVLSEILSIVANNRGRVITLSGAGGVGKTRLAIEAARQMATAFDDGVAFVSLASVTDPALVPATIAQSLNIVLSSASLPERIGAILKDKRLLLVLDNFEHLVDAAPLVSRLQAATSRLSILVTSRVRLRGWLSAVLAS